MHVAGYPEDAFDSTADHVAHSFFSANKNPSCRSQWHINKDVSSQHYDHGVSITTLVHASIFMHDLLVDDATRSSVIATRHNRL